MATMSISEARAALPEVLDRVGRGKRSRSPVTVDWWRSSCDQTRYVAVARSRR